jgi:NAD(P)-dependent dehydrogenase (short-subunit alcohol dehydrogenase family)
MEYEPKVLVTGASVGIGRQTAIAFAKRGAQVVINYRKAEEDAKQTLRLVEEGGRQGCLIQADVSDEAVAARLVNEADKALGGLDVLVYNAGVTSFIPFPDLDSAKGEIWTICIRRMSKGVFLLAGRGQNSCSRRKRAAAS